MGVDLHLAYWTKGVKKSFAKICEFWNVKLQNLIGRNDDRWENCKYDKLLVKRLRTLPPQVTCIWFDMDNGEGMLKRNWLRLWTRWSKVTEFNQKKWEFVSNFLNLATGLSINCRIPSIWNDQWKEISELQNDVWETSVPLTKCQCLQI
jgi:hypothetical protein